MDKYNTTAGLFVRDLFEERSWTRGSLASFRAIEDRDSISSIWMYPCYQPKTKIEETLTATVSTSSTDWRDDWIWDLSSLDKSNRHAIIFDADYPIESAKLST